MKNGHDRRKKDFIEHWEKTFGEPYNPDATMTEQEKEELHKDYKRVFDYGPSEEEVRAKYDDDFNDWLDNFLTDEQYNK